MACFFRQAEHKCQDFMIFLPGGNHLASTDQRISKLCCPSALQRSSRDPSSGTTISSFASKPGILLLQQPRGSTQAPEKKKKKGVLESAINSSITAVTVPSQYPVLLQETCQAQTGVQDLPVVIFSGRRIGGEN